MNIEKKIEIILSKKDIIEICSQYILKDMNFKVKSSTVSLQDVSDDRMDRFPRYELDSIKFTCEQE